VNISAQNFCYSQQQQFAARCFLMHNAAQHYRNVRPGTFVLLLRFWRNTLFLTASVVNFSQSRCKQATVSITFRTKSSPFVVSFKVQKLASSLKKKDTTSSAEQSHDCLQFKFLQFLHSSCTLHALYKLGPTSWSWKVFFFIWTHLFNHSQ